MPKDIIVGIALEYRIWKLLTLTTKHFHHMLGDYHIYHDFCFYTDTYNFMENLPNITDYNALIKHIIYNVNRVNYNNFIARLIDMLTNQSKYNEGVSYICSCVNMIYVVRGAHPGGRFYIYDNLGQLICLVSSIDLETKEIKASVDIKIGSRSYKLLMGEYNLQDIVEYIYINLPSLKKLMTVDSFKK